jgi:hypothetical protein
MYFFTAICFFGTLSAAAAVMTTGTKLNVTAIGTHKNASRFECWELNQPFIKSNQPGLLNTRVTMLGDVANVTYSVLPSGFNSPLHPAPSNQSVSPI